MLPMVIWLALSTAGVAGMVAMEHANHHGLAVRFGQRIALVANFVAGYVQDRVQRQREQAVAFLNGPEVSQQDFARLVAGLGWQGAGLVQLTLLPLLGLVALAVVDPRRMLLPPSLRSKG